MENKFDFDLHISFPFAFTFYSKNMLFSFLIHLFIKVYKNPPKSFYLYFLFHLGLFIYSRLSEIYISHYFKRLINMETSRYIKTTLHLKKINSNI